MIAYGAARYALARGERNEAEELWPLVEWCLEYCRRKLTPEGVVASDTDELEGRFPAGKANLCTSTLYYDALRSAVYLGQELGCPRERCEFTNGRLRSSLRRLNAISAPRLPDTKLTAISMAVRNSARGYACR